MFDRDSTFWAHSTTGHWLTKLVVWNVKQNNVPCRLPSQNLCRLTPPKDLLSAGYSLYRRFSPPNSLHPRFSPPEFVPVNSLFVLFIYLFSAYFSFRRLKSPSAFLSANFSLCQLFSLLTFLSANFSLCQLFLSADFCLRRLFSLQTFLSTQFLSSEVCVPEYIKEIQLFLINI